MTCLICKITHFVIEIVQSKKIWCQNIIQNCTKNTSPKKKKIFNSNSENVSDFKIGFDKHCHLVNQTFKDVNSHFQTILQILPARQRCHLDASSSKPEKLKVELKTWKVKFFKLIWFNLNKPVSNFVSLFFKLNVEFLCFKKKFTIAQLKNCPLHS